jgi:uncharacterized protein YjbJ (UPF0337 family)
LRFAATTASRPPGGLPLGHPAAGARVPLRNIPSDGALFYRLKILRKATAMDKDRIKGSAEQAKGKVKEVAGKVTGDSKLESEGKAEKAAGKFQNAVGGMKDALRGK